jgi:hypothetical protein
VFRIAISLALGLSLYVIATHIIGYDRSATSNILPPSYTSSYKPLDYISETAYSYLWNIQKFNTYNHSYALIFNAPPLFSPSVMNLLELMVTSKDDLTNDSSVVVRIGERLSMDPATVFLNISTHKQKYKPGETVTFIVKNNGNQSLTFTDAALGLKIKNIDTGENYGLVSAQVLTELEPNGSRTLKWNQEGANGVKEGNYTANVTSGLFSANTFFKIER